MRIQHAHEGEAPCPLMRLRGSAKVMVESLPASRIGICQIGMQNAPMSRSKTYEQFELALTSARIEKGFTQQDIATRLGRHQSFVSKYESGERRLDVIEFLDVCAAIGVNPISILQKVGNEHG